MATETVSEAEKMRLVPGIVFVDGPAGRRARLAGRGPDVWEVVWPWLAAGRNFAELVWYYPNVPEESLQAALRYHELFPEEIDARIAQEEALYADFLRDGPSSPRQRQRR